MRRVFLHPSSVILFLILIVVWYAFAIWVSFSNLIFFLLTQASSDQIFTVLIPFLLSSLIESDYHFMLFSFSFSILTSLNIVLSIFFIRMNRALPTKKVNINTLGGIVAGFFGLGCAACGSILLTTSFASIGGIELLTLLPFRGTEIGYIGIFLLMFSAISLVRAINAPRTCPI